MKRICFAFSLLLVMLVLSSEIALAEPPIDSAGTAVSEPRIPPPSTHYKGRKIADVSGGPDWLMRESREREEHSSELLEALEIKPGQVVCDLGSGNGYYTLKLARLVGEQGEVLAVDIQPEMLTLLSAAAKKEKLANIKPVLGTVVDPKLPEGKVDLLLMVDVYHEFSHPEQMLQAIRKCLKPEGRVALVEFRSEDPGVPIKPLHKMSKEQILKEFPPNGFRLVGQFDKLPWQHVMFFQRGDADGAAVSPVK